MDIKKIHSIFLKNPLIDTDTRKIRKGSLFFALKGENFDGNKFAEKALALGANKVIVDDSTLVLDDRYIYVKNVLKTLQELANYHRNYLKTPIIALTGSNGKTTTKELISSVLSRKYNVCATKGNLNNHIGVPLTLLSITSHTQIAVVEMGANHPNEIEFLCSIAQPDYGYITNFGKAHLEGFGSLEGVINSKSELYEYLIEHNKQIFVNSYDKVQCKKTKNANCVYLKENIELLEVSPYLKLKYGNVHFKTNLIGDYNFNNIRAAISIGEFFDIDRTAIVKALECYVSDNNRSQVIEKKDKIIFLDAYNANPTSMKAAIDNFSKTITNTAAIVLGDMFELGNDSLLEHQELVDYLATKSFNEVYLIGDNFYQVQTTFNKYKSLDLFVFWLKDNIISSKSILIKGSRGMALERLVEKL